MKILLTGGSGTLGKAILKQAVYFKTITVDAPKHSIFDITNIEQCRKYIQVTSPDVILHTAAMTNLQECQVHPSMANDINVVGTINLANLARSNGQHFVYVSTHAIFGQDNRIGMDERTVVKSPKNTYALTKLAGELVARTLPPDQYLIARLAWLTAEDLTEDKKFLGAIVGQALAGAQELSIADDTSGSISYAPHVAKALLGMIVGQVSGLRHIVNQGAVTRLELAKYLFKTVSLPQRILPKPSSQFTTKAIMPNHSVLTSHYKDYLLPSWQEAVKEQAVYNHGL